MGREFGSLKSDASLASILFDDGGVDDMTSVFLSDVAA
jgi:hypothetical protein